jgi:hypothetical protein
VDATYAEYSERGLAAFEVVLKIWRLSYERLDDKSLVVPAKGSYPLVLTTVRVINEQTIIDTLYPFMAPVQRRLRTIELAARLNNRLDVGALTSDPDDGELGFRTGLPIQAMQVTVAMAAQALEQHWAAANRVMPGVAALVFTDLSVSAAIAQLEGTYPIDDVVRNATQQLDAR